MTPMQLFSTTQMHGYVQAIDFLERVYARWLAESGESDILLLAFAKVVNDSHAILALVQQGFCIQAGVVARSTMDACSLMIHIGVEGGQAPLVRRWMAGGKVTHWMIIEELNQQLEPQYRLPVDDYRQVRRRLDEFVHATYPSLQLYPAQLSSSDELDDRDRYELGFWSSLLRFYLVTCLLVVRLIMPQRAGEAARYMEDLS